MVPEIQRSKTFQLTFKTTPPGRRNCPGKFANPSNHSEDPGRRKSIRLSNFKTKSRPRDEEQKKIRLLPGGLTNRPGHGDKIL